MSLYSFSDITNESGPKPKPNVTKTIFTRIINQSCAGYYYAVHISTMLLSVISSTALPLITGLYRPDICRINWPSRKSSNSNSNSNSNNNMEIPQPLIASIAERWPILLTSLVILASALLIPSLGNVFRLSQIPLVGRELGSAERRRKAYLTGARRLYTKGYEKVGSLATPTE